MWFWKLEWDEVREDLVIGACPMNVRDLDRVREGAAVTAVLSLQHDDCRKHFGIDQRALREHGDRIGVQVVNVPMRDFDPPDQRRCLPEAVRALHGLLRAGHRVYVHCTAGINRAPLVVLAYLVLVEGLAEDEALKRIRRARPKAEPYRDALRGCRRDLVRRHRAAVARRAWELWRGEPSGSAVEDWRRAEREMLRRELTAAAAAAADAAGPSAGS